MFVRNGQALGSILWRDVPQGQKPAKKKTTAKTGASQPAQGTSTTSTKQPEPPKPYAPKGDWVDYAVTKGADRAKAEESTKDELVDTYGDDGG